MTLTYRNKPKPWTTVEVARLRHMWDELGLTAGDIAKVMGRSREAVCAAARRHGMARRNTPIAQKPDMIRQREIELGRQAAIAEMMGVR